ATGGVATFTAKSATLQGTFAAPAIGKLTLAAVSGGTVASAGALAALTATSLSNAFILSGANFGADGVLGGGDDSFAGGSIGTVKVKAAIAGSVIAAGAAPGADGTFGTADDAGPGGVIKS